LLAQDVDVRHVATKARCVSAASMDLGYHKMLGRTANLGRIQFGHSRSLMHYRESVDDDTLASREFRPHPGVAAAS
jgi:hypothetical protein